MTTDITLPSAKLVENDLIGINASLVALKPNAFVSTVSSDRLTISTNSELFDTAVRDYFTKVEDLSGQLKSIVTSSGTLVTSVTKAQTATALALSSAQSARTLSATAKIIATTSKDNLSIANTSACLTAVTNADNAIATALANAQSAHSAIATVVANADNLSRLVVALNTADTTLTVIPTLEASLVTLIANISTLSTDVDNLVTSNTAIEEALSSLVSLVSVALRDSQALLNNALPTLSMNGVNCDYMDGDLVTCVGRSEVFMVKRSWLYLTNDTQYSVAYDLVSQSNSKTVVAPELLLTPYVAPTV